MVTLIMEPQPKMIQTKYMKSLLNQIMEKIMLIFQHYPWLKLISVIFIVFVLLFLILIKRSARLFFNSTTIQTWNQVLYAFRKYLWLRLFSVAFLLTIFICFGLWIYYQREINSYKSKIEQLRSSPDIAKLTPEQRLNFHKELLRADNDVIVLKNSILLTIAQIVGGFILLFGLYFTWRNLKVAEEGKLTDRFSNAVELLGSEKLDICLGGIYALERIARDSLKDHWTVMEVLNAFVRGHSKLQSTDSTSSVSLSQDDSDQDLKQLRVPTDIQAVMTVMGRRKWINEELPNQRLNFRETTLIKAFLYKADLNGAYFYMADLREAKLIKAGLKRVDFRKANLKGANFREADLSQADFNEADLTGSVLTRAILQEADLIRANLNQADIRWANLEWANLSEANLTSSYLSGAILRRADFSDTNLKWADIRNVDLSETTGLTWEQISNTVMDEKTRLPIEIHEKHENEINALVQKQK